MENKITSSDVWIIQTLIHSAGSKLSASLFDLICIGDAINHAIFSHGELLCGLKKLYDMDIIEIENGKYEFTKNGKEIFSKLLSKPKALSRENEEISKIMNAQKWKPNEKISEYNPNMDPIMFTLLEFNSEYERYNEMASNIIEKKNN